MAPRAPSRVIRWIVPAVAVLALVVGALSVVAWLTAPVGGANLVIVEMSGEVRLAGPERGEGTARAGMEVRADDRLTTGTAGSAVLSAGADTEIRLEPSTDLRVTAVSEEAISVELDGGRVRADVRGGRRAVRVASGERAVRTSDGAVVVAVDDGVFAAEVLRGTAAAEGLDGVGQLVAGGSVTALDDGRVVLGEIPDDLMLEVAWPESRRTRASEVAVRGRTSPGSVVTLQGGVGRVVVRADADGLFEAMVKLREGTWPVVVEATDPFGRDVVREVQIERDSTPPVIRGGAETQP